MQFERNYKLLHSTYWKFLIPTILTVMTGNIALIIDTVIISTLIGVVSLSGVQVIEPIASFFSLLYWMVGLGGSLIYMNTKVDFDEEKANKIFTVAIVSVTLIGLIVMIICLSFTNEIIPLISSSAKANSYAVDYFRMYALSVPFLCYTLCLYYFVRGEGMTKLTFISSLLISIVNLSLDIVLIKFFNMGIAGSGLATAIAYCVGAIFVSICFFRLTSSIKFARVKLVSFIKIFVDIIKSGFAGASNQLYSMIVVIVYNYLLISFSDYQGLFSFQICINTLFFMSIFLIALMQSSSPMLSVYYKEEDYSGVNYLKNKSLKLIALVGFVFAIFLIVFPQTLLVLYSVSDKSSDFLINAIQLYGLRYFTIGFTVFYVFYAQSIQKNKMANIVSVGHDFVLTVIIVFILTFALGISGLWVSYVVTDITALLILFVYSRYIHKKSDGEFEGFYINKVPKDNVYDFTINANVDEAKELSLLIKETLKDNPFADCACLSLEEFLLDTIEINKKMKTIDVFLNIEKDCIKISIKDAGVERKEDFTFENEELDCNRKLNHSRVLGLNNTLITIS